MADRNRLHVSKLEDFRQWLISDGFTILEPQGLYEVLRAAKPSHKHPLIVYRRTASNSGGPLEHYTVAGRGGGILGAYLRDRRPKKKTAPAVQSAANQ